MSVCTGGSLNWAWETDALGWPYVVDLSESVDAWTAATAVELPPDLPWTSPAAASTRSTNARLVAAVISLSSSLGRPSLSDALPSDAAFPEACEFNWPQRRELNLSDALVLSSCAPKKLLVSNKELVQESAAEPVSGLVGRFQYDSCDDLLSIPFFYAYEESVYMGRLVEALPSRESGSCAEPCPIDRPLCNGTSCVRPTCDDVEPLCNDRSNAGALARFACGVTCGCGDLTSALVWIGPDSGCLPACREAALSEALTVSCSDAQPGSAELEALVAYSGTLERALPGKSLTNASVRAALGCFALNLEGYPDWLCDQQYWNESHRAKSLVPYCPVSCGCIDDPSRPGCPRTCKAPEPPSLRDLSDAQLAVANAVTKREAYPSSCQDLNASVCDAILTVWHQHPCPVTCNMSEAYVWGDAGDNTCPENATRIGSAEACKRAAAAMGKGWGASNNVTDRPSGCSGDKHNNSPVSFNAHPVGSGHADARPLCAVGTAASQSSATRHAPCTTYKECIPAA